MICPKCGSQCEDGAWICRGCGTFLGNFTKTDNQGGQSNNNDDFNKLLKPSIGSEHVDSSPFDDLSASSKSDGDKDIFAQMLENSVSSVKFDFDNYYSPDLSESDSSESVEELALQDDLPSVGETSVEEPSVGGLSFGESLFGEPSLGTSSHGASSLEESSLLEPSPVESSDLFSSPAESLTSDALASRNQSQTSDIFSASDESQSPEADDDYEELELEEIDLDDIDFDESNSDEAASEASSESASESADSGISHNKEGLNLDSAPVNEDSEDEDKENKENKALDISQIDVGFEPKNSDIEDIMNALDDGEDDFDISLLDPATSSDKKADAEVETANEAETKAETELETVNEAETKAETELDLVPEDKAVVETEPEIEIEDEAEPEIEIEAEAEPEIVVEAEPEIETESEAEPEITVEAEPEIAVEDEAERALDSEQETAENHGLEIASEKVSDLGTIIIEETQSDLSADIETKTEIEPFALDLNLENKEEAKAEEKQAEAEEEVDALKIEKAEPIDEPEVEQTEPIEAVDESAAENTEPIEAVDEAKQTEKAEPVDEPKSEQEESEKESKNDSDDDSDNDEGNDILDFLETADEEDDDDLELDMLQVTEVDQKPDLINMSNLRELCSKSESKEEKKKKRHIDIRIIIAAFAIVLVALVSFIYSIVSKGEAISDYKQQAVKYVRALELGNYNEAYSYVDTMGNEMLTLEAFQNSHSTKEIKQLINIKTTSDSLEDGELVTIVYNYSDSGSGAKKVKLKTQDKKYFMFFNQYKVNIEDELVKNVLVRAPSGTDLYINNKKVDSKYITHEMGSLSGYVYYKIPALFRGNNEIKIAGENVENYIKNVDIQSNEQAEYIAISDIMLNSDMVSNLQDKAISDLNTIKDAGLANKSFDQIKGLFVEDTTSKFEYTYRDFVINSLHSNSKEVSSLNITVASSRIRNTDYSVNVDNNLTLSVELSYTMEGTITAKGTGSNSRPAKGSSTNAKITYSYTNGKWLISDWNISLEIS